MKFKIGLILILSSGLLFVGPSLIKAKTEVNQNIKQNIKENILEQKEKKQAVKEKRETFMETLQVEKDERKTKIEEMKLAFKEKRDDFKKKIETIKDERKKQLTEKIDNRISTVNKNQTDRMTKALEKLTEHINKLEERVAKAKENGVNVLAIETLIITAKTAIRDALAIVEEQAAKDYAFTITDEKSLGQSVKASYDILSKDLKNAQESLVKAKEAVVAVYKLAATLKNITPTPTVVTP